MNTLRVAAHLIVMIVVLAFVWFGVTRYHYGPVIVPITQTHGIHRGDVPILIVGGIIMVVALTSLARPRP